MPALAATLTICIVFFPVVLLTGPAKFLFDALAIAVVSSMLGSYLLSRTLVPSLSHLLLAPRRRTNTGRGWIEKLDAWRERRFERLLARYESLLSRVLVHRKLTLLVAGLAIAASMFLIGPVGLDFFPVGRRGNSPHARTCPDRHAHRRDRAHRRRQSNESPRGHPAKTSWLTIDDNIGIPLYYNLGFVQTDNVDGADAEVLVALAPEHRPSVEYVRRIRHDVENDFPGTQVFFQPADIVNRVLNFGLAAPIDVQVEGADISKTLPIALKLERALRLIPGSQDVRIAQVVNHPAIRINVDRKRAADIGMSQRDVANSLLTTLSSSSLTAPNFWVNPKNNVNYIVAVQTPISRINTLSDVMGMPLAAPMGATSLSPPVNLSTGPTPSPLNLPPVSPQLGSVATVSAHHRPGAGHPRDSAARARRAGFRRGSRSRGRR